MRWLHARNLVQYKVSGCSRKLVKQSSPQGMRLCRAFSTFRPVAESIHQRLVLAAVDFDPGAVDHHHYRRRQHDDEIGHSSTSAMRPMGIEAGASLSASARGI